MFCILKTPIFWFQIFDILLERQICEKDLNCKRNCFNNFF
jgi:hypothetical protein